MIWTRSCLKHLRGALTRQKMSLPLSARARVRLGSSPWPCEAACKQSMWQWNGAQESLEKGVLGWSTCYLSRGMMVPKLGEQHLPLESSSLLSAFHKHRRHAETAWNSEAATLIRELVFRLEAKYGTAKPRSLLKRDCPVVVISF